MNRFASQYIFIEILIQCSNCHLYFKAGYQITQQFKPLAENGRLTFNVVDQNINKDPYSKTSLIKQIQLEQDSGRTIHDESSQT